MSNNKFPGDDEDFSSDEEEENLPLSIRETGSLTSVQDKDFTSGDLPHPELYPYYQVNVHRHGRHKLGSRFCDFRIIFRNTAVIVDVSELLNLLYGILENCMAVVLAECEDEDVVMLILQAPSLEEPIRIPQMKVGFFFLFARYF